MPTTTLPLSLTETDPVIKPYDENKWVLLEDARTGPLESSLMILTGLHTRWLALLESLDAAAYARCFVHPDLGPVTLGEALGMYAWHSRHHTAHITSLRETMSW